MTSKVTDDPSNTPAPETDHEEKQANASAEVQNDVASIKAEAEQWRDKFLRKAAELENYRKRCERERQDSAVLTKSYALAEFLPVLDACERARISFGEEDAGSKGKLQKYREGVELLYKQLYDVFSRQGVVPIEAKGRQFDPHLHEAVTRLETMDYEDNVVIEELRRGYLLNERLLRAAQVVVASRPKPAQEEDPQ